jgi:hypothetical protein
MFKEMAFANGFQLVGFRSPCHAGYPVLVFRLRRKDTEEPEVPGEVVGSEPNFAQA